MKEFKKYYIIPEQPEIVYKALTNEVVLSLWTGYTAIMEEKPDTEFELWDGSISGKNISFVKDREIVQEWYFGEQEEKSIVTFKLHPHKKGTSLELLHTNIPAEDFNDMEQGWEGTYMADLIDFFTGE
tara:strand:- start:288 stop:671 length:384 start_codon:yes stop_codon:yes gene_type:complete